MGGCARRTDRRHVSSLGYEPARRLLRLPCGLGRSTQRGRGRGVPWTYDQISLPHLGRGDREAAMQGHHRLPWHRCRDGRHRIRYPWMDDPRMGSSSAPHRCLLLGRSPEAGLPWLGRGGHLRHVRSAHDERRVLLGDGCRGLEDMVALYSRRPAGDQHRIFTLGARCRARQEDGQDYHGAPHGWQEGTDRPLGIHQHRPLPHRSRGRSTRPAPLGLPSRAARDARIALARGLAPRLYQQQGDIAGAQALDGSDGRL